MKLDYDAVLTTPKGEPVEDSSLGAFLYEVLLAHDNELTGEKKLKLARLAKKVVDKAEVTVEEVALMKERVHKFAVPAVILCVEDLLEGRSAAE